MTQFDLVIFDCDGVLVDSEPIIIGVLAEMLTEMGHPVSTTDIFAQFHGRSTAQWMTQISDMFNDPLPDTFFPTLRQRAAAALLGRCDADFRRHICFGSYSNTSLRCFQR